METLRLGGGLFGSTTIPEKRWKSDSAGISIEEAILKAAKHPIITSSHESGVHIAKRVQ